ncbi:crotonase/enoyl-CoA hydratase family protein [Mariprofundus ferrooxydans]|uniref:crotonase/enoyl-CoA hydratase family protein n=1 Tax=Mariprofundus ferrooxydans TaxID=314344 RepID=UPI0003826223|nr:crotonase/enoyl-CoA hydratase family protein [Mariprofundus ferrooxydans]
MIEQRKQSESNIEVSDNAHGYRSLQVCYEEELGLAWFYMQAQPRPCFTPELITEILDWCETLSDQQHIQYVVGGSKVPGIFNLGGDLNLFLEHIERGDREGLLKYVTMCNQMFMRNYNAINGNITTISLVQGDALGGGFEAAISSEVLIAERGAKMGLPDILFNLFPGAGAYSLLSRKIGMAEAERLILSGRLYSAEEMYELGVVDVLAEEGAGRQAVYDYIKKESRLRNGYRAFRKAKRCCNPITFEELMEAANIWVDTAFRLESRDLRMIERLVKKQSAKSA